MRAATVIAEDFMDIPPPSVLEKMAAIIESEAPLDEARPDPKCDDCGGDIEMFCVNCHADQLKRAHE